MYNDLNDDNFILFAAKNYTNPSCTSLEEFDDDLRRIRYIKRLFVKYKKDGDLKERLILNHLCVFYNVFESKAATKMLVFRLLPHLDYLKPFLILLDRWDLNFGLIMGKRIVDSEIPLDKNIVKTLRSI